MTSISEITEQPDTERAPCPLCGGAQTSVLYRDCNDLICRTGGKFNVVRCLGCDLVRTDARPTRETIGQYYPSFYSAFERRPQSTGARRLMRDMLRLPYVLRWGDPAPPAPSPGRVLDVGAGIGADLERLTAAGWEPWGIEPNPAAAAAAVARLGCSPHRIQVGSAEDSSYENGTFDLVLMLHVVEHLHDPAGVLSSVSRWLRPGGQAVLRCPNFDSFERRIFRSRWRGLDLPRHLVHFSRSTLEAMLREVGLVPRSFRPELQASSLVGSIQLTMTELRGSGRRLRSRPGVAAAMLPITSLLTAAGYAPTMEMVATRR